MRTFREFLEERDPQEEKPLFGRGSSYGQLRNPMQRFDRLRSNIQKKDPEAFRKRYTNTANVRYGIEQAVSPLLGASRNASDVNRTANTAKQALSRLQSVTARNIRNRPEEEE